MTIRTKAEPRLNPEAWLGRALEVLREEGIQGVRVERVARDLGVTKGSFYWHFKDRPDLHRSILRYWTEQYNDVVVENREFLDTEPAKGLLAAITRVREEGLDKYELAMRAWADHDSEADEVVRAAYEKRSAFVRGFFTRLGFRGLDAEVRTRLTLCYLSWEPNMYPDESEARRLNLLKFQHNLLTRT
ncbi:TetR/AcrR family transcriptional regulator [Pirellulales bacterium]|nr:TetR/AcrR family transcriptional regulator [Pirellulales bacterium]